MNNLLNKHMVLLIKLLNKNEVNEFLYPKFFENLPDPDEKILALGENSIFQNTLEDEDKEDLPGSQSVESSILKKIQTK